MISLQKTRLLTLLILWPAALHAAPSPLGSSSVSVRAPGLDLDLRLDLPGVQHAATSISNVPVALTSVTTTIGVVAFELSGPDFPIPVTVRGRSDQTIIIPRIENAGVYRLLDIRLENEMGQRILDRDSNLVVPEITIIDEILVTQVETRPLTQEEIDEKGIVITDDNYTVVNFTVGFTFGSEQVEIELPVAMPTGGGGVQTPQRPPFTTIGITPSPYENVKIPNLEVDGFVLTPPPELEELEVQLPPITGVVIIPGNIAFLNQFFSVLVVTTNAAPGGSGLTVTNARARIALPKGADGALGSGDDPLRMASTTAYPSGIPIELPLRDQLGSNSIPPQATNKAEYLVEGLAEGTHRVDFDILGDLFVPALGTSVPVTGKAAGVVQVRNPTFNVVLSHPEVVRAGEEYSVFATVTNTSSSPANQFKLSLATRSISGARLAPGASEFHTLASLGPAQAESFEFRLVTSKTKRACSAP